MQKLTLTLTFMVTFAITLGASPSRARAQHPAHAQGGHPGMNHNPAPMEHEMMLHQWHMEQEMLRQQQLMVGQHQQMMMEHQQRMLEHHQAQAAKQAAQAHTAGAAPPTSAAAEEKSVSSSGSHRGEHAAARTHPKEAKAVVHHAHSWLVWPAPSSAAYRNLMNLKQALDSIAKTPEPTVAQRILLHNQLLAVANSPRPAAHQVQDLSNNVAVALSTRGLPEVDTRTMALQLRALMNSAHLTPAEVEQTIMAHRRVLSESEVQMGPINTVSSDLQDIAQQLHSRPQ